VGERCVAKAEGGYPNCPRSSAVLGGVRPGTTVVLQHESDQSLGKPVHQSSMPRSPSPTPGETRTLDLGEGVTLDLQYVPAGTFWMGTRDGDVNACPRHRVEISQGFWLGRTPVTLGQYWRFHRDHRNNFSAAVPDYVQHPVIEVSWHDAMQYCDLLTQATQRRDKGWAKWVATLPTEAQWEYACRGEADGGLVETDFWNGDGEQALAEISWFDGNSDRRLHRVGTKQRGNAWGLHDMHGLVWEWCQDVYDPQAYGRCGDLTVDPVNLDDKGDNDAQRVLRGGSWGNSAAICRCAFRFRFGADFRFGDFGFRVALVPGPSRAKDRNKRVPESADGTRRRREALSRPTGSADLCVRPAGRASEDHHAEGTTNNVDRKPLRATTNNTTPTTTARRGPMPFPEGELLDSPGFAA
jgi:formylglycine-generating enzyme required for sulfatase activity